MSRRVSDHFTRKALVAVKPYRQVELWEWYAANIVGKVYTDDRYEYALQQVDALNRVMPVGYRASLIRTSTGWRVELTDGNFIV